MATILKAGLHPSPPACLRLTISPKAEDRRVAHRTPPIAHGRSEGREPNGENQKSTLWEADFATGGGVFGDGLHDLFAPTLRS